MVSPKAYLSSNHFTQHSPILPIEAVSYTQRSNYNLLEATKRQVEFFYNISLHHYRDTLFLETSLIRYKIFLLLMKNNPRKFIALCYDIDLM